MRLSLLSKLCTIAAIVGLSLAFSASSKPIFAQAGGPGGDDGDGDDPPIAGIDIDANGVLRVKQIDPRQLAAERRQAMASANVDPSKLQSPLRKVSLTRLEAIAADRLEAGKPLTREMLALAGLTRINYVFFYPESGDIVLAGPAEQCIVDSSGRAVGLVSGHPPVHLDDLITALRAYGPQKTNAKTIGCSIDPTQEGLKRMAQALASYNGSVGNSTAAAIANTLKNNLGFQEVSVYGVPNDTHFAQVLVEADYRMKLIGIGLEQSVVKSWAHRANPGISSNALQRWYFTANYKSIKVSPDHLAMKLDGQGVKLIGENELVRGDGSRVASGKVNRASKQFTEDFTNNFNQIAEASPVFYEMRNLFDVSVVAAYIQERGWYSMSGWDLGVFASDDTYPVQRKAAPKQVDSAVNAIWKAGQLMTPIGGGVQIQARRILNSDLVGADESVETDAVPANLRDDQWWWD